MRRSAVILCLLGVFAWLGVASALAQDRVALIVGNSGYDHVTTLENPGNDARDMAIALEGLGFRVFLGLDLGHDQMIALTDRFEEAARSSKAAVFYYAGHGFQVDARNYLVPVDARIQTPNDVTGATVPLDRIIGTMERAPGLKLVFLDACRDNPFEDIVQPGSAAPESGLARVGDAADFMISFATQPDNVAYDGVGRNSFFTEAILNHIHTPGQDISDLMISVRKDVLAATGGLQIPWENSSLTRQFQFDDRPESVSQETLLWQVAAQSNDPELLLLYAERYPEGTHLPEVLASLDPDAVGAADTPGASRSFTTEGDATQGDRLWDLAQRSRSRPLIQLYLRQYPDGSHAERAETLIATLPERAGTSPAQLCERLATHPRDATASVPGVPYGQLAQRAFPAIQACETAVASFPNFPRYTALLARAQAAAGDQDAAIANYRSAADRGDLRALVSLGLLTESGRGVSADPAQALRYFEAAANGGSLDGMINLAVSLFEGRGIAKDIDRAADLLKRAADGGSAIATYNLGVLSQDGVIGTPEDALGYFRRAARVGEPRGYLAAAILLDEGRGTSVDPAEAAVMLLRGAAEDGGQTISQLVDHTDDWSDATLQNVARRLSSAGHLADDAPPGGSAFADALNTWRNGGFVADVLVR